MSSDCIILKTEIIRTVAGLCIFKHDPVTVVCLVADDSETVVVSELLGRSSDLP